MLDFIVNILDEAHLWNRNVGHMVLLLILFVVPNMLQRFSIPPAISSFGLGVIASYFLDHLETDNTLKMLATFGIVALFLSAGLEVSLKELKDKARFLFQSIFVFIILLAGTAFALNMYFKLEWVPALFAALALSTPSAGFIMNSLKGSALSLGAQKWVAKTAISIEIFSLIAMFVLLQIDLPIRQIVISSSILIALIFLLPAFFSFFEYRIAPYAPNSEVGFLLMLATVSAFITYKLGIYYLIGAFLVGFIARRLRDKMPAVSSERVTEIIEIFAAFFAPFYFFRGGNSFENEVLTLEALLYGIAAIVIFVSIRLILIITHRQLVLKENYKIAFPVALYTTPTLIFTLVLASILREKFALADHLYGSLIVYAIGTSLFPMIVLKLR